MGLPDAGHQLRQTCSIEVAPGPAVLVVDDDDSLRETLRELVREAGVRAGGVLRKPRAHLGARIS